jgi:K(+)-stimulated pyrophosphate-energized sodium pump
MVDEVRRQFREIPGLLEGKAKPDYSTCVDISTKNALKGMVPPATMGLVVPILFGFIFGIWPLIAFLIAVRVIGAILALFMFNAGGAWDNAKKYIEMGHFGGKGTPTHAAAVIGDTFGDPLKDTAGPSLRILIMLEDMLSLTLLPLFLQYALFG